MNPFANKLQTKLRRLVEAIAVTVTASAAIVGQSFAHERVQAPVATFHVECFTARAGLRDVVEATQSRIAEHRAKGNDEQADLLHAYMLAELMEVKWREVKKNTVTTVGKNDLLDKYFAGSSYTAAWYCGLISLTSYSAISAADTMSSHAGWLEAGAANAPTYSQSTRVALTFASASGGNKATSSASSFTFTGTGTIRGMFGTSVSTKDGTTGILYNAVLFTGGDRAVVNTDVVNVSVTYSA